MEDEIRLLTGEVLDTLLFGREAELMEVVRRAYEIHAAQNGLLRKHEHGCQPGWLRRRAGAQQISTRSTVLFRVCDWSLAFSGGLAAVPLSALGW